MKKRKAVDSYFHAIRNTVGKDRSVIMPYGNGSSPPSSKDEDSVPTGSMKGHLLTRSAGSTEQAGVAFSARRTVLCL